MTVTSLPARGPAPRRGAASAVPDGDAHVIRRAASPRASSFALWDVDVAMADGTVLRLVAKDLSPQRMLADARRVRPSFLADARREALLYESVLSPERHGTARCYGTRPGAGAPVLLLERVEGAPLEEVGHGIAWHDTARWLGRFHAEFAASPPSAVPGLVRYDRDWFARWPGRAARHLAGRDRRAAAWLAALDRRYGPVADTLDALDRTLVHGDFHPSNVVVAAVGARVCVLDWEQAGWGPALLDLAALVSGRWAPERRQALVRTYRRARGGAARAAGGLSFAESLELCRLHLALQWLGWAPDWTPEERRRADWLQVARDCADRLGI